MITLLLVFLFATIAHGWYYRAEIKQWANGGAAQVKVNPKLKGLGRHTIAYVDAHGGPIVRPLANRTHVYWFVGGKRAVISGVTR